MTPDPRSSIPRSLSHPCLIPHAHLVVLLLLIAQACGYNSDAYLKNLFKKRFGLSMRAWRALRDVQGDAERTPE
ncbi:MAG: AraC family transcriptional regulator [Spirochaetia bacterium]|nr:AraC family transcriptional regulator [Spirochaetia bacterium]